MSKPKTKRQPATVATAEAKCHSDQRLVSRWSRQAKKLHHNATLWRRDKKADKLTAACAVEWSIGLATAYKICAQELEAANDGDERTPT